MYSKHTIYLKATHGTAHARTHNCEAVNKTVAKQSPESIFWMLQRSSHDVLWANTPTLRVKIQNFAKLLAKTDVFNKLPLLTTLH